MICYKIRSKKNNTEDKTHIPQYKFSIFLEHYNIHEAVLQWKLFNNCRRHTRISETDYTQ
jgi:hypothetical protein